MSSTWLAMTYEAHLASTIRNMQKFWKLYILIKSWFWIQLKLIFRAHRVFNKIVVLIFETFSKKKSEIWFAISIVIISMWWTHQTVSIIQKLGTYFNVHTEIKKKNSWTNSYLRLWFTQGPNQWAKIYRTQRRTDYYCGTKKPLCSCLASTSCKSAMSHRIACL